MDMTAPRRRPLRVGIQLPEIEWPIRWPDLAAMIRRIETLGFDSIWTGDHFLYHLNDGTADAPWDAWSVLAAAAAITSRVTLGPLVTPVGFYNPAVLAKKAATVDEISGGRLVLGLGAGWNEVEFRGYGVPFDHRISRFEEAFTIDPGAPPLTADAPGSTGIKPVPVVQPESALDAWLKALFGSQ